MLESSLFNRFGEYLHRVQDLLISISFVIVVERMPHAVL